MFVTKKILFAFLVFLFLFLRIGIGIGIGSNLNYEYSQFESIHSIFKKYRNISLSF